MSAVWDTCSDLSGTTLLLMLALVDFANDEGLLWPSIPTIAAKVRLSERQTMRQMESLIASGYVERIHRGDGRGRSSMYKLTLKGDASDTLCDEKRVTPVTPISEKRVTSEVKRVTPVTVKGDIAMSHYPLEPSLKPTTTPNGAVGGVFKLWEQNMPGTLSPVLVDQIHAMIAETSAESVIEGIKVAVANGVRKPSYVRGVAVRHASGEGKPTSMQNAKGGSWAAMKTEVEY
jgi:hypothetical protein